jgi:4-diphosphocytidyl-2-C-methyl-D-erythritol kinase
MVFFPSAKINIGLNVIEKRKDGFHNIETVFFPIDLCDVLEFAESSGKKSCLSCSGISPGTVNIEDNLVIKAFRLLQRNFNLPDIEVHLHKIIPVGAGLGGGSSDAAFMLKALNEYFKLDLDHKNLLPYSRALGSDCSFFLNNTISFASGKGDDLKSITVDLEGYYIAVVYPVINIDTAKAYSLITPRKPEFSLTDSVQLPLATWKNRIFNDFENVIFPAFPETENIKKKLYSLGALYSSMSGSGSSVFGIFGKEQNIKQHFSDYFVWEKKIIF